MKNSTYRTIALSAAVLLAIASAACNDEQIPTAPTGEQISICHTTGGASAIRIIRTSELPEHFSHGDYVTQLLVNASAVTVGDSIHFRRIGDAIASARAIRISRKELSAGSCRITIKVAGGMYRGSVAASTDPAFEKLPLVIDVPDITLAGSLTMQFDEQERPIGPEVSGTTANSVLAASPGLVSIKTGNVLDKYAEPLIVVNTHPDGSHGDGAVIQGFWFQSGNEGADAVVGGNAVWAMRSRVVVRRNLIDAGFAEPVEFRASIGRVDQNLLTGRGGSCAICMFGPGDYDVISNRQSGLANRLAVLVFPAIVAAIPPGVEPFTPPAEALVTASVRNNDFRDHQEVPFGIGVRVAAIGPGAPNVAGTASVAVTGNDLSNNRFAVVAEAGFPVANTQLRGNIQLSLIDNILDGSCEAPLLVAFNSQSAAVGLQTGVSLRNSTFTLTLGDNIAWDKAWYSHPSATGNTLDVDGKAMEAGSRAPYDAARSCSVK